MALVTLPSAVKIRECRMRIGLPTPDEYQSQVTRRGMRGAAFREVWFLDVALAPMSHDTADALAAVIETADGRVGGLSIDMLPDVMTRTTEATAVLAADPARGSATLSLDITGGTIPAGCLLGIGDIENGPYQLVEVLDDAAAGSGVSVNIAPRIRRGFTTLSAVAVGANAKGRFRLAGDDTGQPIYRSGRVASAGLNFVEAV